MNSKKEYYKKNRFEILCRQREKYASDPKVRKRSKIDRWKRQGIIDSDFDLLFDAVNEESNCYICLKEFKFNYDRCIDHDHNTGEVRYILCRNCNGNLLRGENKKINQYK